MLPHLFWQMLNNMYILNIIANFYFLQNISLYKKQLIILEGKNLKKKLYVHSNVYLF